MISSEKTTATNDIFICWYKTNFCISVSYFTRNHLLLPVYGMTKKPQSLGFAKLSHPYTSRTFSGRKTVDLNYFSMKKL